MLIESQDQRELMNYLDILENGVPVNTLVDIIQQGGVMEGIHSLDVGIIIAPALVEVISNMADNVGIRVY